MNKSSNKILYCLAAVVLVGGCLRFYGLRVGFPFEFHVDEWFIVKSALEMYRLGTLKPPAFDYPSLVYYLLLAGAHIVGLFREPQSYDLHLLGRAISAFCGTATILVVYLTGKRAHGERTGLLAAAFFAFTVTALRESHYYTTDSVNTFFIALAVHFIVKISLGDDAKNYLYAGIAVGLAAGSKYNGAFLVVPLLFAHVARIGSDKDSRSDSVRDWRAVAGRLLSPRLFAAGLVSLVVFFGTTPYALIERALFLKDLRKMGAALSVKVVEGNHHYIGTTAYLYYVENLLFWAMGPVLEAACLLGLVYALVRRRRQDIVIALWVIVYFLVVGGWLNKAVRYTLPMLPFLAIFGAAMFVGAAQNFRARGRHKMFAFVAALACVTLVQAFLYSLAYVSIYTRPHTSIQAARWAHENAPAGSTILIEDPTPHERPPVDGVLAIDAGDSSESAAFKSAASKFHFLYLDVPKFSRKDGDEARMRDELNQVVAGADYVVMTIRWYEGLVASPEASPVIKDYYRALTSGESDFELVREFTSYPSLLGFEIKDDSAELNFRLFDHPKVWVFKKKSGLKRS